MSQSKDAMPGIGPVSRGWLAEIEITTLDDLRAVGAPAAYARLNLRYPRRVSLNLLYGLHDALEGLPVSALSNDMKAELRRQAEADSALPDRK